MFQISPGVQTNEIDLTGIVPAVSTTEAGLVGHFSWGPVDLPVLTDSEDVLAQVFGLPGANTYIDFFTGANFLAYGNQLHVVRVIRGSNTATLATDSVVGRNATTNSANNNNTIVKNSDDYVNNHASGITGVGSWIAKYPGVLGNSLKVSVCSSANAYASTLTGTLTFANSSATVTGSGTSFLTQLVVGDVLRVGRSLLPVSVLSITTDTSLVLTAVYSSNTYVQGSVGRKWEWADHFPSAPGTSASVSAASGSNDEMHVVVLDEDGFLSGTAQTVLETYAHVSKASDAFDAQGSDNYYVNVLNSRSLWVWWTAHVTGITNVGKKAQGINFGVGTQSLPVNASFVKGRDGASPRDADYLLGYDLFRNADTHNISFLLGSNANQTKAVYLINNVAEERKDCLVMLSPRQSDVVNNSSYRGKERDDAIAFRNLLPSSSYAFMDSSWKYQYDKYNDVFRWVPMNGDTAGLCVRTDTERDPWWSPGGFNRGNIKNVVRLSWNPTQADRDQLYKSGINPIVSFTGMGTVLYGDKTLLAKPSAFDRIKD